MKRDTKRAGVPLAGSNAGGGGGAEADARALAAEAAGLSFEEAVARLEGIVERIEKGEVGLEESITEYERGMALIERCRGILKNAEQRVDELTRASGSGAGQSSSTDAAADADEEDHQAGSTADEDD